MEERKEKKYMRVENIIKFRKNKLLNKIIHHILISKGIIDIPCECIIGKKVKFPHNAIGTVLHNNTIIKDNVKIYQNVTLGRADIYTENGKMGKIIVDEGAIICAGAKVLGKNGDLVIGKNAIVAANAVLLNSIGENEIWGGYQLKRLELESI